MKSNEKLMKKLITLLLIIAIQITFTQKVIASVMSLEGDMQSMIHCEMDDMNMDTDSCGTKMDAMKNCQIDCEMMSVVSVIHFIENEQVLSLAYTQLSYPIFITTTANSQPKSLYRPPLFS